MSINSTSLGKIILTGEHSVVYGYPALAIPTKLATHVKVWKKREGRSTKQSLPLKVVQVIDVIGEHFPELDLGLSFQIFSSLPQNSGLGSSAALAHALVKAIAGYYHRQLTKEQLFQIVQKCEKIFHGKPSGIDAATVVYETCLRFIRSKDQVTIKKLDCLKTIPPFLLLDSGKATETTKAMIKIASGNPAKKSILKQIGAITQKIENLLQDEKFSPELITENERLLEKLGVVGKKATLIIRAIEEFGGFAKITGAGGVASGSGVIIAFHKDIQKLKNYCKIKRFHSFN
ncbi:MAG: mevalonate kinase [Candidatus Pacebacteria bacterium RIFOXYB1_FULL_39_46]|nr:MAG: mevalonate kinase [Candidatus Pacebacteria bacterium RIFOXYA1_FULL_38_18]OGJ38085.1 MAG: mevalonate kinase [Candidatus Pacebacteria bacterium RIFOXYB1_FULL_39_46]OGJ39692.1 MAG: mevalonate kinase [Candidatus Pacebacteria bacterium RIFOXYC1_FULL_39_21]OGJ39837.1 MAG: mevalonate kinase [Candidatus Pacebacteria bacterium RIFOXYD1_FULL_39_27]